jgi:hypothetical protein
LNESSYVGRLNIRTEAGALHLEVAELAYFASIVVAIHLEPHGWCAFDDIWPSGRHGSLRQQAHWSQQTAKEKKSNDGTERSAVLHTEQIQFKGGDDNFEAT